MSSFVEVIFREQRGVQSKTKKLHSMFDGNKYKRREKETG